MKNLLRNVWILALLLFAGSIHSQISFTSTMPSVIECSEALSPPYVTATSPCGPVSLSWIETFNFNDCSGIYVIEITATSACGEVASYTNTATIIDTMEPVFLSIPQDLTISCTDAIPPVTLPTAQDNCDDSIEWTYNEEISNDNPCSIQIFRLFTASDDCGNSAYAIQIITVVDDEAPVFTSALLDHFVECDYPIPPPDSPQAVDNCDAELEYAYSEEFISEGCATIILRTYTAQDDCGNISYLIQTISIYDTTSPVISGDPVIYNTNELTNAFDLVTISDNCSEDVSQSYDIFVLNQDPNYGAEMLVLHQAIDDCGNITQFYQTWFGCAPVGLTITHNLGGSLAGVIYTIVNNNGNVIESGVVPGGATFNQQLCLPAGCYSMSLTGPGGFNPNVLFTLTGTYDGTISGNHTSNYTFSIGAPCGVLGCMNPAYCNYDPLATEPGICSVFCLDYVLEVFWPLPDEDWGFILTDPLGNLIHQITLPSIGQLVLQPLTTYSMFLNSSGENGWNNSALTLSYPDWNWNFTTSMGPNGPYQVTFTTGGPGCTNPQACNYNPAATVDDGSCYTTFGCTDPLALNYNPLANCSSGGCIYVINDEKNGALPLTVNAYDCCQYNGSGSLTLATASANSQSTALTGEDIWYSFVAPEPGISIKVTSSSNNILVELQNSLGQMIDAENIKSTKGNEILNYGNLIVGSTYYIAVRNYNSAQGKGAFTICLQSLRDSKCASNNPASLTPCSKFFAFDVNPNHYNYTFTSTTTGLSYTLTNASKNIDVISVPGLIPNDTYLIKVQAVYRIANSLWQMENVVVTPAEVCTKVLLPNPSLSMQQSENCQNAGAVSFNTTIKAVPNVCNAVDYQWEFTNQNGIQPTFTHLRGNSSKTLKLSNVAALQNNSIYNVRVRQIYPNGVAGQYGSVQCLSLLSCYRSYEMTYDEDEEESIATALFYPNPNNGKQMTIDLSEITEERIQLEVVDITGKAVHREVLNGSNGSIVQINFEQALVSGTYFIKLQLGEELKVTKLIVQ